jgi:putative addiction module component (TIGR02574 family)
MSPRVEQLLGEIQQLSTEERSEFVYRLLQELDSGELGRADEMWSEEMVRRVDDMRSGRVEGIPYEEVMEALRKEFPDPPA